MLPRSKLKLLFLLHIQDTNRDPESKWSIMGYTKCTTLRRYIFLAKNVIQFPKLGLDKNSIHLRQSPNRTQKWSFVHLHFCSVEKPQSKGQALKACCVLTLCYLWRMLRRNGLSQTSVASAVARNIVLGLMKKCTSEVWTVQLYNAALNSAVTVELSSFHQSPFYVTTFTFRTQQHVLHCISIKKMSACPHSDSTAHSNVHAVTQNIKRK